MALEQAVRFFGVVSASLLAVLMVTNVMVSVAWLLGFRRQAEWIDRSMWPVIRYFRMGPAFDEPANFPK